MTKNSLQVLRDLIVEVNDAEADVAFKVLWNGVHNLESIMNEETAEPPKTRAIEIAPGVFAAPEGYTGPVEMICRSEADDSEMMVIVRGKKWTIGGVAAEVAAKLWPVHVDKSSLPAGQVLLDALRKLHDETDGFDPRCIAATERERRALIELHEATGEDHKVRPVVQVPIIPTDIIVCSVFSHQLGFYTGAQTQKTTETVFVEAEPEIADSTLDGCVAACGEWGVHSFERDGFGYHCECIPECRADLIRD